MKTFSEDLRWRVIFHQYIYGSSVEETCRALFVGKSFVYDTRKLYREQGDVTSRARNGRRRLLSYDDNCMLRNMVETKPELYLDEYVVWFTQLTGKQISIATMCRSILRLGFTYKKLKIIAVQRNESERAEYFRFIASIPRHMLLFLDESAKDKKKLQRTMGHFLPGHNPAVIGQFVRQDRYSVLAAMDMTGIIATHTIPGAFSTIDFNFAMKHMISPHIGNFALGEHNSVVVLDNCRIHDSDEFIQMIRDRGGIAVFLPPYSCDLNPIECAFGLAKQMLKRNRHLAEADPKYCLASALEQISQDEATSFFNGCGYRE